MPLLNQPEHERYRKNKWTTKLSKHYSIPLPSSFNYNNNNNNNKNMSILSFCQQNLKYISISIVIFTIIILPCIYMSYQMNEKSLSLSCDIDIDISRNLLSDGSDSDSSCYSKASDPSYLAIFYFLGTLYMFIALSIVCDEFFVPSLETITYSLSISKDVAGATLMAAGGSAPELFTSLIGTFQKTDVGFAAIVGSAVFNVLFVIGICALLSPKPLSLTWWPLFRDCTYYAFGLSILSIFFIIISSKKIEWFESLILFLLYIGYVIFMKYNKKIYNLISKCIISSKYESSKKRESIQRTPTKVIMDSIESKLDRNKLQSVCINSEDIHNTTFRAGMLNILLSDKWDWNINDIMSVSVVNNICGDVNETFSKLDIDKNGFLDITELQLLLNDLNADLSRNPISDLMNKLDTNNDGLLSFKEFSVWYIHSEERILGEMKYIFNIIDEDKNGILNISEIHAFLITLGCNNISHNDIDEIFKINNINCNGMTFEQFKKWFISTPYYQEKLNCFSKQAQCIESIDNILSFPQSIIARFWFILTIPLILLLILTIPDTRKPGKTKYCYLSFIISIIWIGIFSYFLVEWTSILGDTLKIPLVVMGLTFLAAGTSIPDLLSSVIVAKQGYGDMALSSSIGSNIFDILVGLPIPWLLFSIYYNGEPVKVNADGLEISILILLIMLIIIIILIKLSNWKMTKYLGIIMIILYIIFVIQDLIRADWTC